MLRPRVIDETACMVVSSSRLPAPRIIAARGSAVRSLSVGYLTGLSGIAQPEPGSQDGWRKLEQLCKWLTDCYHWPEWPDLWVFAASDTAHRRQEDEALHRLAMATGAHDPQKLELALRVVLDGAAVAAALGDSDRAAKALPTLLAAAGRQAGIPPLP